MLVRLTRGEIVLCLLISQVLSRIVFASKCCTFLFVRLFQVHAHPENSCRAVRFINCGSGWHLNLTKKFTELFTFLLF